MYGSGFLVEGEAEADEAFFCIQRESVTPVGVAALKVTSRIGVKHFQIQVAPGFRSAMTGEGLRGEKCVQPCVGIRVGAHYLCCVQQQGRQHPYPDRRESNRRLYGKDALRRYNVRDAEVAYFNPSGVSG